MNKQSKPVGKQETRPKTSAKTSAKSGPASGPVPDRPFLKYYPRGVDYNMPIEPEAVSDLFQRGVKRYALQVCVDFFGRKLSYAELGRAADKVAAGLQRLGIGKGDRIGLLMPNTPAYMMFYYGVLQTGAAVVNFNPLYSESEIADQIEDSQTQIIVTHDLKLTCSKIERLLVSGVLARAIVVPFADQLPMLKSVLFSLFKSSDLADWRSCSAQHKITPYDELVDNDGDYEPVKIDPVKDLAVLQYTGGTTGTPKGAMLTHANLSANVAQVTAWSAQWTGRDERVLGILPFFHVFAMTTVMNFGLVSGAEIILMPKFELDRALDILEHKRPTIMPGVPTLFNAILNAPGIKERDLSSLKYCISGGAPLPIEIKRRFEALTRSELVEGYGLSETSPVVTCNPLGGPVKEGSIGIPLPRTDLEIRAIDAPHERLPIGEDGELCVRGPQVMAAYWNKPEETRASFIDGAFRTGDVGHMDEDGFVYIVDRLKDMINASGFKIYPRRIEEAIYQFDGVEEVTVVGIPDEYRGEAPKAFIKMKQGHTASEDDIIEFLKPRISKLELPAQIAFRDELPKTMIGKLSKKELREESPD